MTVRINIPIGGRMISTHDGMSYLWDGNKWILERDAPACFIKDEEMIQDEYPPKIDLTPGPWIPTPEPLLTRDRFAIEAMNAIIQAEPYVDRDNPFFRAEVLKRCKMAYLYADCAMEVRK